MLKVCFQAITTGQKIWSRFPAPRQTIREMSGQLGMNAAKIVEVESDGSVFAPYLIGKEVPPEKGYKEVDFLERRMECLTRKEQQVFQEALEMEHPETLEEMVNLSCNLDKFELLEDGKVIRTGEVLDTVYDSEPLPDVGYEKDSVFWLRLDSPFYKRDYGRWYPLSLPADEEKLERVAEVLGVSDIEEGRICFYGSRYQGIEEVLPLSYGIRGMNAFAGCLKQEKFLCSKEGMEKLFSALEAERPENMQEVVEIAMRLELYEFLPEKIVTAEDYGEYLLEEAQIVLDEKIAPFIDIEGYGFSQMEKNGIVQTEHGLIFRKDKPIQMLPKEFEGIRLFSPLTTLMYGQEGYESDEPEEITPTQLCRYVSAIKKQLIKEQLDTEGDRGLAEYIRNRILRQKVFRMFPDVEVWQGELWGVLEIESYGKLSDTELNAVIAEWSGQASDGWGEGFEQRPIRTEEGDLYVSFWNSGSDYFITTEEKLKDASLRHSDVGRGGIGMRMG